MRLLMMGTGPFAVPTLHALLESHHAVTGLVTRPLESSRSRKAIQNPMLEAAQEAGIPVEMPADINSPAGHEAISRFAPELLVVCDYGQILSSETLQLSPLGGINLHGSLLPRYRGAAPVNWPESVAGTGPRRPEARHARTAATMDSASSSVSAHTALAHSRTRGSAQRADGWN